MRETKAVINSAIVIFASEGFVKSHNYNLHECNSGQIKCTKHWAKHFLNQLGYSFFEGHISRISQVELCL